MTDVASVDDSGSGTAKEEADGTRAARRSRRWLGVVLVALAGIGAAVLIAPSPPGAEERVRSATRHLHDASPFALHLQMTLEKPDGSTYTVTSNATVDDGSDHAHQELADVIGPGDLEIVTEARKLYVSVPEALQAAVGARWLRVDARSRAAARGAGFGPLPDPLTVLHALDGATRVSDETIADDLRHRSFLVDLDAIRTRDEDGEDRAAVLAGLGRSLEGDVWLDADGRARRVHLVADLGDRGRIDALLDVTSIGEPVAFGIPRGTDVRIVADVDEALALLSRPAE